jgi:hypothetical protein
MFNEPHLENKSSIELKKKEYYQGFLNKEEFKDLHKAKSDLDLCN